MRIGSAHFILLLAVAVTPGFPQAPQWYQVPENELHPPARDYPAMAYDEQRQQVLLFGGLDYSTTPQWLKDTWVWDGRYWSRRTAPPDPPILEKPAMARNVFPGSIVLFGTAVSGTVRNSYTYVWDGTYWMNVSPSSGQPANGTDVAMVHDEARNQVLLFAGCNLSGSPSNELWRWDGTSWNQFVQPVGAAWPDARCYPKLAYDRQRAQVVLFGGWNGTEWMNDTWVWDGAIWTRKSPAHSPPADGSYPLAADNNRGLVLALGPIERPAAQTTWYWNGSDWLQQSPQPPPPPASDFALSETMGGVLAVGGSHNGLADSWVWGVVSVIFNKAPIANAGPGQNVPCANATGAMINLDGSASSDPDGDPLTFTWTGPFGTASGVRPMVSLPLGVSTIQLMVSDGKAASSAYVTIAVTVNVSGFALPMGPLVPFPALPPVPDPAMQAGRTLPLKLTLSCGGRNLTNVSPPFITAIDQVAAGAQLPTVDLGPISDRDTGTRFRLSEQGTWIFNLGTSEMAPGLYLLTVQMPDALRYRAAFALR